MNFLKRLFGTPSGSVPDLDGFLDALPIDAYGAWGIPWGSTRDKALETLPDDIVAAIRKTENRSPRLLGCEVFIAGFDTSLSYSFGANGLDGVDVTPLVPIVGALQALTRRFGKPLSQHSLPGIAGPETLTRWSVGGFEVEAQQTVNDGVTIIFTRAVRSRTGIEEPDPTLDDYPSMQAMDYAKRLGFSVVSAYNGQPQLATADGMTNASEPFESYAALIEWLREYAKTNSAP